MCPRQSDLMAEIQHTRHKGISTIYTSIYVYTYFYFIYVIQDFIWSLEVWRCESEIEYVGFVCEGEHPVA
jgi:hypothetical protein